MHTEHLRNVQLSWVAFGWFVALAVASGIILLLVASGALDALRYGEPVGVALAVAVGWAIGGFIAGFKTAAAPILHGAAMAIFTFVVWFFLNLAFGGVTTGASAWEHLTVRTAALALLVQGAAAIAGCWAGYRWAPLRVE